MAPPLVATTPPTTPAMPWIGRQKKNDAAECEARKDTAKRTIGCIEVDGKDIAVQCASPSLPAQTQDSMCVRTTADTDSAPPESTATTVTPVRPTAHVQHHDTTDDASDRDGAAAVVATSHSGKIPPTTTVDTTGDPCTVQQDDIPTPVISNRISPSTPPPPLTLPRPQTATTTTTAHTRRLHNSKNNNRQQQQQQQQQQPLPPHVYQGVSSAPPRFSSNDEAPIVLESRVWVPSNGEHVLLVVPKPVVVPTTSRASAGSAARRSHHQSHTSHGEHGGDALVEWLAHLLLGGVAPWVRHSVGSVWRRRRRTLTNTPPTIPTLRLPAPSSPPSRQPSSSPSSFSSLPLSKSNVVAVQGIPNFGQTCFLNSVVQALASLESWLAYVRHLGHVRDARDGFLRRNETAMVGSRTTTERDDKVNTTTARTTSVSDVVRHVLESVNGQHKQQGRSSSTTVDPRPLLQAVGRTHEQFRARYAKVNVSEQQDAHELLQALLDTIVEECAFGQIHSADRSIFCAILDDVDADHSNERIAVRGWDHDAMTPVTRIMEKRDSVTDSEKRTAVANAGTLKGVPPSATNVDESHSPKSIISHKHVNGINDDAAVSSRNDSPSCFLNSTTCPVDSRNDTSVVSKAMQIVRTTTSSISPSPFSGWIGSALMCHSCRRVRSIQSTPFVDLGVVPTAVSHYLMAGGRRQSHPGDPPRKPGAREPACTLEECLEEYTSIERVQDVECRFCTIQAELKEFRSEEVLLEETLRGLLSRRRKQGASEGTGQEFKDLQDELSAIKERVEILQNMSPDDDSPFPNLDPEIGTPDVVLERSDAFKCLLLTRLPAVLSIHIQRRYYDQASDRTSKTMQHVAFPEILDVAPYCAYGGAVNPNFPFAGTIKRQFSTGCAPPTLPMEYKLMSVIEHQGGPLSGHYVCYRRNPVSGQWLWISDDKLVPCTWERVKQCQAYMLFYEAL